jgi:hypothetical protein
LIAAEAEQALAAQAAVASDKPWYANPWVIGGAAALLLFAWRK